MIKPDEYRVALTPAGALELVNRGHEVMVEVGGRDRERASPTTPTTRAARRSSRRRGGLATSELLLKVKEPMRAEYAALRDGADALHLPPHRRRRAADPGAVDSGVAAVAYETVETPAGAAAARADVGGRGAARGAGGRVLPREAVRRPRRPARRRPRRRARPRSSIIGGGIVGYNAAIWRSGSAPR